MKPTEEDVLGVRGTSIRTNNSRETVFAYECCMQLQKTQ